MKKTLNDKIIPLMLSTSIITTFMYIYNKKIILLFGLISFVLNLLIFSFYDYFSKKGIIARYFSILIGFTVVVTVMYVTVLSGNSGEDSIDFMIWFLSPQVAVTYSARYTYTLFLGINVFISSTVYYFTQVRYRIFVTFLIMLIPLAIFAKENEKVPIPLLALLLIFYIAVMIHCRQTADSEQNKNIKQILDSSYKKSALTFIFSAVIISFAIPKPEIEANREYFESIISANDITQYLLSKLGDFSDTSNGSGFSGGVSNSKLFYCYSEEPLNLKARTYTDYNLYDDTWYVNNSYDRVFYSQWEDKRKMLNPANFFNAVYYACEYDKRFSEKYNIQYKNPKEYNLSQYTKTLSVYPVSLKPEYLLTPSHAFLTNQTDAFLMSQSGGAVRYSKETNSIQRSGYPVSISYYSDMISDSEYARNIMENLNAENYNQFLNDLKKVLLENNADEKLIETTYSFIQDYENALDYFKGIDYVPSDDSLSYSIPVSEIPYIDYTTPENLAKLALEITKNCYSDIEKAEALEVYFYNNNFIYDADYIKPKGYNTTDFIFEDKKGACYEYSTAMVLMARAIGIPARYNEGFMLSEYDEKIKAFSVTDSDSHAYPELFISGYGWLVFEPTISDMTENQKSFLSQQIVITLICIGTVFIVFLAVLFIKFVYPALYEKYFRYKMKKASSTELVKMIVKRLRKLSDAYDYFTSGEFQKYFYSKYNIDISELTEKFDLFVYGECITEIKNTSKIITDYENIYAKIIENNKKSVKKS